MISKLPQALHFVGIGGIGMSAVAQALHARGHHVTGSDLKASGTVERLRQLGIPIALGHRSEHLGDAQGIVISTAVAETNPELVAARQRGLAVLHRSEPLAALMAAHRSVAVTGTHGKTTTSGMIATMLINAGLDPTVLLGGELTALGGNYRGGQGPYLVAEADESDRSILRLSAEWVVVTNLEGDHLDHYRDLDDIIDTMARFLESLGDDAQVVACSDDPGVRQLLPRIRQRCHTYGFLPGAEWPIGEVRMGSDGSRFTLAGQGYGIAVPGRHNVANAAAAAIIGHLLGVRAAESARALSAFSGVGRRFQLHGEAGGVAVYDDYAHHPSEIRATLQAAGLLDRPVHVVFQPHRYSRTAALADQFARCFEGAATVTILDVYAAGEAPGPVDGARLAELTREASPQLAVRHVAGLDAVREALLSELSEGDVVLLMGAGNVNQFAAPLLQALRARSPVRVR